ncbi:MAG: hypothetical protein ACYS0D_14345 [Planctomycetota bacterium]|jgi:hypothetical protein
MKRASLFLLVHCAAFVWLGGCSVYDGRFVYDPRIVSVTTTADGDAGLGARPDEDQVRTLVSVIGIRRDDSKSELPASVEVRLRVENDGTSPVGFNPTALSLVSADLQAFPEPIVQPAYGIEVEPGAHAVINAYFPLNDADLDLTALNVRWSLFLEGRRVSASSDFTRRRIVSHHTHWHHHYHVGFGFRHSFYCW